MRLPKHLKKGKSSLRSINLVEASFLDNEDIDILIILSKYEDEGITFIQIKAKLREKGLPFGDSELKLKLERLIKLGHIETYEKEEYGVFYLFYTITREGYLAQEKLKVKF